LASIDSFRVTPPNVAPALAKGEPQLSDLQLKLYERALARDPRNHFLLLDLAREYGRHRRVIDAECTLRRLVELYPESAQICAQAAAAFVDVGLPLQAIEQFRRSLEIAPDQPDAAAINGHLARLTAALCNPAAG
jgi:tetratricopeptide (TPR) repeat protein